MIENLEVGNPIASDVALKRTVGVSHFPCRARVVLATDEAERLVPHKAIVGVNRGKINPIAAGVGKVPR